MISDRFTSLPISKTQIANLDSLGYRKMTAVQAQSLPHVMQGKDLIAHAKTGSGKTAAFGIGLLHQINPKIFAVQALVLDEADRMLDMGFYEVMSAIIARTPKTRQTLLFSASYPESIKRLCRSIQRKLVTVTVEAEHQPGVNEQLF